MALIIYECWFGFFPQFNYVDPGINNGYSLLHLVIIYLIGRYIKINDVPTFLRKCPLLIYIFSGVLLTACIVAIYMISETHSISKEFWLTKLYGYCNPIIILMSVCLFLSFEKIKLKNSVIVNHIAKSMFPVLLLHTTVFWNDYLDIFKSIYNNFSGLNVVVLWCVSVITIFMICIVIDQIRIVAYNYISEKIN